MKTLDYFIHKSRYSAEVAGPLIFLILSAMFLYSGALFPKSLPEYFTSSSQLLGQVLLLILTPVFLVTYLIIAQRRSVRLAEKVVASRLLTPESEDWGHEIRARTVLSGVILGFLFGLLLNVPPEWRNSFFSVGSQVQSIIVGQVFVWTIVGLALTYRLHTAWTFYTKGKVVHINLYETSKYIPFARNGLDDVFGITMLLVLATLQSMDAQFRLTNYMTAWIVAFPAAASLLILPMLSLQRRLLAHKKEFLEEMNRQVSDAARVVGVDSLTQIELLIQHRDRIAHTSAWPIDMSITTRLILYIVIPPIAWFGAAIVEVGLDRILSSS